MKKSIVLLFLFMTILPGLAAQETLLFNKDHWDIFGGRTDTLGGREAFTGVALLKDVQFDNGTIEWDLWATGDRSYAGVVFRQQPTRDSEEFYIRPHKANGLNGDAFQYTPVYHGISCWQLSHGYGRTRTAKMPFNKWVHFKLSVRGNMAVITMYSDPAVTMVIDQLKSGNNTGRIGVKGPADGSAYFSNFKWSAETDIEFPEPAQYHSPAPGIIDKWEITQPFTNDCIDPYRYYKNTDGLKWISAKAENDGLVNLTRVVIRNPLQPGWLYARTTIMSDSDKFQKYQLGYSDYVTVFVNGRPLMTSTNAYLSRDPGFAGLIGYFDEVFLPLKKGKNEICLLIGEQFGGWGFMMRDGEAVRFAPGISRQWELKHQLNYPESAVYDPETDMLFVSNYLNSSGGGISMISTDGSIKDLDWVEGLGRPTGITILENSIYVVERRDVAVINKETGKITNRINLEGCIFPNDITSSKDGLLYVSDNEANKIFMIRNGKASVWMEGGDLKKPNGIECKDGLLFVGCSGDSKIRKIDMNTKEVSIVASLPGRSIMDGLQALDNGALLFSDYAGHLFYMDSQGNVSEIINTVSTQVNLADFEYIKEKKLLVVPGLYSNVLAAYYFTLE